MPPTEKLAGTASEAVDTAIEEVQETPEETPEETEVEETSDEEPEQTDPAELSEDEQKQARELFKLLKNKDTQKATLRILAENAGVLNPEAPPEKGKDETKVKRDVRAILKEKLGDDFKFISDKLGDALEEIIGDIRDEYTSEFQTSEQSRVAQEVVSITEKLNRETKGDFKRLEARMSELADELLPGPKMSVEKYMRHLYQVASSERRVDPKNLASKIERNRTNAADRLRTTPGRGEGFDTSKKYSLKESVRLAAESIEKGRK